MADATTPIQSPAPKAGNQKVKESKPAVVKTKAVNLKDLPVPEFVSSRLALFEELYRAQCERREQDRVPLQVTLLDGTPKEAVKYVTTPFDIAKSISPRLAEASIVARFSTGPGHEQLWDMGRPLEVDGTIEFLDWEYPEAKTVFWHSSAHVLGRAMERALGCRLISGPPLSEGGFFYEADTGGRALSDAEYGVLESAAKELVAQKATFQRLEVSREDLLRLISYNDLKSDLLGSKVPQGATATVYRCGDLVDPCRGPHIMHTGLVKGFAVTKHGAAYFLGKETNPTLQRVYAMALPTQKQLDEWLQQQALARERDHRKLGVTQELFHIGHEMSPGSGFWFPHGARIYNRLMDWMKKEQRRRGFEEVITPNMYSCKLWETSGHWQKYKDDMFTLSVEGEQFGLKPMNCPGHCLMFGMRMRSVRELPIRFADFGVLHRNERSGALTGMTRVRRFCQDDAHIFCTLEQVTVEVRNALQFIEDIYAVIGFKTHFKLSTRPEPSKRFGDDALWDKAESLLTIALNEFCHIENATALPDPFDGSKTFAYDGTSTAYHRARRLLAMKKWPSERLPDRLWEIDEGGGAFYGPKVDIQVEDALGRGHQCATLQLDFNLPERFNLKYQGSVSSDHADCRDSEQQVGDAAAAAAAAAPVEDCETQHDEKKTDAPKKPSDGSLAQPLAAGWHRPVMIHRAIFGSLERFIAIIAEHFEGGKWPFWLSPRQLLVVPVASAYYDYAMEVRNELFSLGYHADADLSPASLNKKVLLGQQQRYNFILVVGEKEMQHRSVNVRVRGTQGGDNEKTLEELKVYLQDISDRKDNTV